MPQAATQAWLHEDRLPIISSIEDGQEDAAASHAASHVEGHSHVENADAVAPRQRQCRAWMSLRDGGDTDKDVDCANVALFLPAKRDFQSTV
jgi:hypothetical protein